MLFGEYSVSLQKAASPPPRFRSRFTRLKSLGVSSPHTILSELLLRQVSLIIQMSNLWSDMKSVMSLVDRFSIYVASMYACVVGFDKLLWLDDVH